MKDKSKNRVCLLVATHKHYNFPQNEVYLPIQVGKAGSSIDLGIAADNTGEHISEKNSSFCELTALYWAWKNGIFEKNDYVGLVHYRRYFSGNGIKIKNKLILDENEAIALFKNADCIVPKKRNYYIETVYSHYANAHHIDDLELVKDILFEKHPSYVTAYEEVMKSRTLHLFNMFIMNSFLCEQYCEWLFPILFELEKKIDTSNYSAYQQRIFGFIAERLFNIWLIHNKTRTIEVKVANLEKENLYLKALNLLKRKFLKNAKQ